MKSLEQLTAGKPNRAATRTQKHTNDNSDIDFLLSTKRRKKKGNGGKNYPKTEKKDDNDARRQVQYKPASLSKHRHLKFKVAKGNHSPVNQSRVQGPDGGSLIERGADEVPLGQLGTLQVPEKNQSAYASQIGADLTGADKKLPQIDRSGS